MVAIKGMEMPSCCKDCIMCTFNMNVNNPTVWYCKLTKKDCGNKFMIERHTDCPLVEIEEPKTGHWIKKWDSDHLVILAYECSECGVMMNTNTSHYCPNCGAYMREVEE